MTSNPNHGSGEAAGFQQYRRSQIAELRPYVPLESLDGVSISAPDVQAGSPKLGDMIARNPKNHADQWLVAAQYFANNFEPAETIAEGITAAGDQLTAARAEIARIRAAWTAAGLTNNAADKLVFLANELEEADLIRQRLLAENLSHVKERDALRQRLELCVAALKIARPYVALSRRQDDLNSIDEALAAARTQGEKT